MGNMCDEISRRNSLKKFHNFTILKLAILITIIVNLINIYFKFYTINRENIASSILITYFSISAINILRIEFSEIIKNKQYIIFIPSIIYIVSAYIYLFFGRILNIETKLKHMDIVAISILILIFNIIGKIIKKLYKIYY